MTSYYIIYSYLCANAGKSRIIKINRTQTMRVVKIYFSPTGNTKSVVDAVASSIDPKGKNTIDLDITLYDSRVGFHYAAQPQDLVIFGMPVYAGRIPNLLLPFVKSVTGGPDVPQGGIRAVPIVTYGGRNYDDALIELADILENSGFSVVAAGAFIAEHSFSNKICNSLPDNDSLSFAAKLGGIALGNGITAGNGDYEEYRRNEIFVGKQSIKGRCEGERVYYRPAYADGSPINMLKVKPITRENCSGCGLCASRCPMGVISAEDPAKITGPCIKCNRCVRECPVGAKYFDDAGYLYHVHDLERKIGNGYNVAM